LPLQTASFDLALCHFVLLWVANPVLVLHEMARVTRPGGSVLALAEPDYAGRIDYPPELECLGSRQRQALEQQGADPAAGRKLAGWFAEAGLAEIEVGILGSQWLAAKSAAQDQLEREVLISDLQDWVAEDKIKQLLDAEATSRQQGRRVLFVPTFYAWGRVPA
jgi:SAM-dependent methyltransferase